MSDHATLRRSAMEQSRTTAFPASKLVLFVRAVADPEGKSHLTPELADAIKQVEANVARATDSV